MVKALVIQPEGQYHVIDFDSTVINLQHIETYVRQGQPTVTIYTSGEGPRNSGASFLWSHLDRTGGAGILYGVAIFTGVDADIPETVLKVWERIVAQPPSERLHWKDMVTIHF